MPLRPNFFIVGAPRSGTTSIWTYLSRHPNVYMSYQKEPMYFGSDLTKSPNEFFVLETNAYLEMFQRGADKTIRGEASVMYLFSKKAAQEIHAFNPNARILIMLRNPVEMIYSFHGQLRWGGYENIADFDEALAAEADRRRGLRVPKSALVPEVLYYSEVAEFAPQVERYLRVFPRDQIKIILFDDADHALDADSSRRLVELLRQLGQRCAIVLISARPQVMQLAQRRYRLSRGHLVPISPVTGRAQIQEVA